MVVLAFAQHFKDEDVYDALRTVGHKDAGGRDYFAGVVEWLATPPGREAAARADKFKASVQGRWESGSMGTSGGLWTVMFTRCHDGQRRSVRMEYPTKRYYTDGELAAPAAPAGPVLEAPVAAYGPPVEFNENDCSGVFDGHSVTSDADPGL